MKKIIFAVLLATMVLPAAAQKINRRTTDPFTGETEISGFVRARDRVTRFGAASGEPMDYRDPGNA